MKVIGLDARMVGVVPSGLGTYAAMLARYLPPQDPENTYVIIRRPGSPGPLATGSNVREVFVEGDLDQPPNLFRGGTLARLGLDLYHSLYDFLPLRLPADRVVLTLHDLIWIEQPRLIHERRFGPITRTATHLYARATMPYAIKHANHIIAISAHTRERAIAYFGVDPHRITVVAHGVDREQFPPASTTPGAARPFFLCVGAGQPQKNLGVALEAFAIAATRFPDLELVFAGRGDSNDALQHKARQLGIEGRVTFKGPVPHADLLRLLHTATALVFPSLVEGFGLPVLEAMSAGCPVICSAIPTLREVTGDAALLCDPIAPYRFADTMQALLVDDSLRQELRLAGHARAALFDWPTCAQATRQVYRTVLEGRSTIAAQAG
jgi:glycosyltransferase involved in cell wall biosynthesis